MAVRTLKKRRRLASHAMGLEPEHVKALSGDFTLEDVHEYRLNRALYIIYIQTKDVDPENAEEVSESGITPTMANQFARGLSILSGLNPERPILAEMSTDGGEWEAGIQMFDSILACPNPVTVLAHRWARSMSSIVPLAADKFVMMPGAKYMFHHGTYSFGGLEQEADTGDLERREAKERMLLLYVTRLREQGVYSKWSEQRIVKMLEEKIKDHVDVWLSSREARRWGFADDVFNGNWSTLRAEKRNEKRRKRMLEALHENIKVDVRVSSRLRTRERTKRAPDTSKPPSD
ncbi:hypothetical protein A3H74_03080 [Candidatus Kaiserbacteria bacterium RIFCSPLOWO2_02_FULL_51_13]|nr:MAG: hypothetical protein A3H74_03080 [Candidatus Kaiserbacteria bacterium RIFCSPLOWO2_02_FULL_51_13]